MRRTLSAAALLPLFASACSTVPAAPSPDLSSGTPYCANMAVWELPGYPASLPAPSGTIEMERGLGAEGSIDVTLKTLGAPQEIAAFYACALPYVGYDEVAALPGDALGFSYSGPEGVRGKVVLTVYDLPFPDDGWDTIIRIVQTP
ncbi:hypothetical protein MB02_10640 [Croceicoccus estronivorus]|nr:hypothetical protein MB02_10640 [Croceicoccus estronivorus]